jgi:hypothetical protein
MEKRETGNFSILPIKTAETATNTRGTLLKVAKFMSYVICLILFFGNSLAIFQNFASDIKIRSTSVVPSPGDFLDSPIILVCNSSAYKDSIIPTNIVEYKNKTMTLDDYLVGAYIIDNAAEGILKYRPVSIMDDVKEIATMFQGNCIVIEKRFQVTRHFMYILLILFSLTIKISGRKV